MAFSYTKNKQGVMGDLHYEIFSLTDVADDSSSYVKTGLSSVLLADANIEKIAGNVINVVSRSGSTVTLDAETAGDDGTLIVLGY